MTSSQANEVLLVTELYYPEETSTGHVMTTIAEGLAASYRVQVVCTQPTYSKRGITAPRDESHNSVTIRRARSTTFDNRSMVGRLVNLTSASLGIAWELVGRIRSGQVVFVVTNPPTLPYVVALIARLRRAQVVLLIHDLFPEILEVGRQPTRRLRIATAPLHVVSRWLVRAVDDVVVLGPDQAELVERKLANRHDTGIHIIPLGFDSEFGEPASVVSSTYASTLPPNVRRKCLFQFAGNIGPLQGVSFLIEAISEARVIDAHFCFIGNGRSESALNRQVAGGLLPNVTLSPRVPRSDTQDVHAGCDVIVISLAEGMYGISVPSRIANALASGRPILGIADEGSAIDRLITENEIGWSIRPGDKDGFWAAVAGATSSRGQRQEMGARALALAGRLYRPSLMNDQYCELVEDILARGADK